MIKLNGPLLIRPYIFYKPRYRRFLYITIIKALAFIILPKNIAPFIPRRLFATGLVTVKQTKKAKSVISLRYSLIRSKTGIPIDSLIKQK